MFPVLSILSDFISWWYKSSLRNVFLSKKRRQRWEFKLKQISGNLRSNLRMLKQPVLKLLVLHPLTMCYWWSHYVNICPYLKNLIFEQQSHVVPLHLHNINVKRDSTVDKAANPGLNPVVSFFMLQHALRLSVSTGRQLASMQFYGCLSFCLSVSADRPN